MEVVKSPPWSMPTLRVSTAELLTRPAQARPTQPVGMLASGPAPRWLVAGGEQERLPTHAHGQRLAAGRQADALLALPRPRTHYVGARVERERLPFRRATCAVAEASAFHGGWNSPSRSSAPHVSPPGLQRGVGARGAPPGSPMLPSNLSKVRALVSRLDAALATASPDVLATLDSADGALRELARQLQVHTSERGALVDRLRRAQVTMTARHVSRAARLAASERELRRVEREIADLSAENEAVVLASREQEASLIQILANDAKRRFARSKSTRDASAQQRILLIIFEKHNRMSDPARAPAAGAPAAAAEPAVGGDAGGSERPPLPPGLDLSRVPDTREEMLFELLNDSDVDERLAVISHALRQPWARPLLNVTAAASLKPGVLLSLLHGADPEALDAILFTELPALLRSSDSDTMALLELLYAAWTRQGEDVAGLRLERLFNALSERTRIRCINELPLRTDREAEAFIVHEENVPDILSIEWEVPPGASRAHAATQYVPQDALLPRRHSIAHSGWRRLSGSHSTNEASDAPSALLSSRSRAASVVLHVGAKPPGAHRAQPQHGSAWERVGALYPSMHAYADQHGAPSGPMAVERLLSTIGDLLEERLRLLASSALTGLRLQPWSSFAHMCLIKQTGAKSAARLRMAELIAGVARHQAGEPRVRLFGLATSLVDDALPFADGRIDFIVAALAVLLGPADGAMRAAFLSAQVHVLLNGKPRKLLVTAPPSTAGGTASDVAVEVRSAEAVLQAMLYVSDERLDDVRKALADASVPLARMQGARAVPLLALLQRLLECYNAQLSSNRAAVESAFDDADDDHDGAISAAQFGALVSAYDSSLSPAIVSALMDRVHEASERLDPAVGDGLLRGAYVECMMSGAPGLTPAVQLHFDDEDDVQPRMVTRRSSLPSSRRKDHASDFAEVQTDAMRVLRPSASQRSAPDAPDAPALGRRRATESALTASPLLPLASGRQPGAWAGGSTGAPGLARGATVQLRPPGDTAADAAERSPEQ